MGVLTLLLLHLAVVTVQAEFNKKFLEEAYVVLSMDLTMTLQGRPEITLAEIHDMSKQAVFFPDFSKKQTEVFEKFIARKHPAFKKFFHDKFLMPRLEQHVTERLNIVLSYYLSKSQIVKFRNILLTMMEKSSKDDVIQKIKDQISVEIGKEKANDVINKAINDLRILYKMYKDALLKVDEPITFLVRDEL